MKSFEAYTQELGEIGIVQRINKVIVFAEGLPSVKVNELVIFEAGGFGQVLSLNDEEVEILLFSKVTIRVGTRITRTGLFPQINVGNGMLGKVIDPLGNSLETTVNLQASEYRPIFAEPLGLASRKRINKAFETGVSIVDLIVPLGKGQRELVVGDRKTGKTQFILQTILNQAKQGTICIYAGIGKKKLDIKKIEEFFERNGIRERTVIVASSSDEAAGMVYLTPYAAMSIAEYFRDQGIDVFLTLDDLLTHARFYREIALLGGGFPGRNSYPGDIFFAHSHLLERAGNFKVNKGTGEASITSLVIAETAQGDLSGYIPTNLMSMTDGHIFFDAELFTQGRKPAVNPSLSVTRVGKQVQHPLRRDINREINSFLTYYEKSKNFSHFGNELNEDSRRILNMGDRIMTFFNQASNTTVPPALQILFFGFIWRGFWEHITSADMKRDILRLIDLYSSSEKLQQDVKNIIGEATTLNILLGNLEKNQTYLDGVMKSL